MEIGFNNKRDILLSTTKSVILLLLKTKGKIHKIIEFI